jgi:hypothetical protein
MVGRKRGDIPKRSRGTHNYVVSRQKVEANLLQGARSRLVRP